MDISSNISKPFEILLEIFLSPKIIKKGLSSINIDFTEKTPVGKLHRITFLAILVKQTFL